jgi:hypothetical protein
VSDWLIDKSALIRLAGSPVAVKWAGRIERGLVRITAVTRFEVGYSGADHGSGPLGVPDPADFGDAGGVFDPAIEDRALRCSSAWLARASTARRQSPT